MNDTVSICEGNDYLGWTKTGVYVRNLFSSTGCDSTLTTNLIVYPSYSISEDITICEGESYKCWSETGKYTETLTSNNGCDSIVTTKLFVNDELKVFEDVFICKGESYEGYTEPGIYERVLTSISECDSIVTTNLTVNPNHNIHENISICEGENYLGWTKTGQFSRSFNSIFGCDSIITTNLVVNNLPITPYITQFGNTLISSEILGNQWYFKDNEINGATDQELVIAESGDYYVIVTDDNGCISEKSNTIDAVYTYLKSLDENKIRIHPNPVKEFITIEGLPNDLFEISVYDVYGTLLIAQNSTPFITSIDISELPIGMYLLIVLNNQKSQSFIIIKY